MVQRLGNKRANIAPLFGKTGPAIAESRAVQIGQESGFQGRLMNRQPIADQAARRALAVAPSAIKNMTAARGCAQRLLAFTGFLATLYRLRQQTYAHAEKQPMRRFIRANAGQISISRRPISVLRGLSRQHNAGAQIEQIIQ